jgi:hypothetical protein
MDASKLIRSQHRRLEYLLARVDLEKDTRLARVLQLVEELMTHLSIEDHLFLNRVADETGVRVESFRESQAQVRNAMLQTVFVEDDDETFVVRLGELRKAFAEHALVLERDLLPLVESRMVPAAIEALGDRMQSFWDATVGIDGSTQERSHAAE